MSPQPKRNSISLAEESTKPVCQSEMQEFPVRSPENRPRTALGCDEQRSWARAAPRVAAAQSWMLIKAPSEPCRHVGWSEERKESCGRTGVLCSPPWTPVGWEPNTAGGLGGITSVLGEIIAWSELWMAVTCIISKLYL